MQQQEEDGGVINEAAAAAAESPGLSESADSPTRIPAAAHLQNTTASNINHQENQQEEESNDDNNEEEEDDDDDFEFSFVQVYPQSRTEDIFPSPGGIFYPIFNHPHPYLCHHNNLMTTAPPAPVVPAEKPRSIRGPLRQLFIEEEKYFGSSSSSSSSSSSVSSSSVDELDGIPPGTYCVWAPNSKNKEQRRDVRRCKKSNSTGSGSSSFRWKLRDLVVGRSRSDGSGNHRFFFVPIHEDTQGEEENNKEKKMPPPTPTLTTTEDVRKVGRKSFLPYKQDIVGPFANVNVNGNGIMGKSQTHHHFSSSSSS